MAEKFELGTTPLIYQPNAPLYAALRNPDTPVAVKNEVEKVIKLPPCHGESQEQNAQLPLAAIEAMRKRCMAPKTM